MTASTFGEGRRQWLAELARGRRERLHDPLFWADLLQLVKTALAGALAWWVAIDVLHLEQPFLAPWAAVLVVHATLYRTVSRGAQQVAATFAGVFLAWGVGLVVGLDPVAMGVLLVLAFAIGRLRLIGEESTSVATTAIVVLATNAVSNSNLLWSRLADTLVGVVIGMLVNLLVWPPLRDRAVYSHVGRLPGILGDLLVRISDDIGPEFDPEHSEDLLRDARRVDLRIDRSWALLWQAHESRRFNPRTRARDARVHELKTVLHLFEQSVAEVQSMIRTVAISAEESRSWGQEFRDRWTRLLCRTGEAVRDADGDALLGVRQDLQQLAADLSTHELAGDSWHEYGGLIINLRNVVDAVARITAPPTLP